MGVPALFRGAVSSATMAIAVEEGLLEAALGSPKPCRDCSSVGYVAPISWFI